jgi:hypothetical protein
MDLSDFCFAPDLPRMPMIKFIAFNHEGLEEYEGDGF